MLADAAAKPEISSTSTDVYLLGLAWFALALACGIAVLALRRWATDSRGRLLPAQRQRAVPWGFAEIGILLLLCLAEQNLLAWILGIEHKTDLTGPELALRGEKLLWVVCLARPLQFMTLLLGIRVLSGAQFYQMGLTVHRWANDFIAGYLVWLLITPVVYLISSVLLLCAPAERHPLEDLLTSSRSAYVWLLAIVPPVLLAPLTEELLFRGLIQPWLTRFPRGAELVMGGFILVAVAWGAMEGGLWPWMLIIMGGGGYLVFHALSCRWLPRPGAASAIYASSILFAAIHAEVWPSPIPLFVLSLGLGWLAYRTQSLVAPIVAHSLFNAVASVALLMK